jgi:hypothetical protein
MLALRAAWAAYVDGWARVLRATRLLAGLSAAAMLCALPNALGVDEVGGRLVAFAADVTMGLGGAAAWALDTAELAYRGTDAATYVLALVALLVGAFVSGGVLDRYARRRPVDARTFWGCAGELVSRLLRLTIVVAILALGLGWLADGLSPWLQPIELIVALVLFIVADCARVRLVVERRRSVLFAIGAGARFARRQAAAIALLYTLLVLTLATGQVLIHWVATLTDTAADAGVPVWLGSIQVVAPLTVLVPALVCGAAVTSLFQASLAHAGYVAPPRLVWPDAPAIETLGDRRDFPPSV